MNELLDEIVADLQQHHDVPRVKKLLLFACHDFWVGDAQQLQSLELHDLIQEAMALFPSADDLKNALASHVKRLNKPGEYLLIADAIIDTVGLLYALPRKQEAAPSLLQDLSLGTPALNIGLSSPLDTGFTIPEPNFIARQEAGEIASPPPATQAPNTLADPFEVRRKVANAVTPLRAKLLLASLLERKLDPRTGDWAALGTVDLDSLLEKLPQAFSTFASLEEALYGMARQLYEPSEYEQVAYAIAQAMKPSYPQVT